MSAIKWAFAVGVLLIGVALVGVFAQMASQVLDFTLPEQVTEPKVETAKNEIKNITKNQTYAMRPFS